jgi:hypothetical protein
VIHSNVHGGIPKTGGDDAEFESAICICPACPGAHAQIDSRSDFNRIDGGHDRPSYTSRGPRNAVVLQSARTHQLYVPYP